MEDVNNKAHSNDEKVVRCTNCDTTAKSARVIYDEKHGDIYEVCGNCGWDILDEVMAQKT